ncbi:hypothetical protein [Dokdonella sp.]|uniref:hypothetical protein n=1 Tax=Dokdonella sp. TaxID=2291710 RepID=UPI0026194870|nr:hypothetical protein [Dokdonella sp.]
MSLPLLERLMDVRTQFGTNAIRIHLRQVGIRQPGVDARIRGDRRCQSHCSARTDGKCQRKTSRERLAREAIETIAFHVL